MKMKSVFLSAILVGLGINSLQAQLYSSGNNTINGNNIGIGTSTPDASLEVSGSYDPNQLQCLGCPPPTQFPSLRLSTQLIGTTPSTTHHWDVLSDNSLIFKHSSNVGQNSEVMKLSESSLEINSDQTTVSSSLYTGFSAGTTILGLGVKPLNGNWQTLNPSSAGGSISITNNGSMTFETGCNGSSSTDAMVITNTGNVGIGTLNPTSALELQGGDFKLSGGRLVVANSNGVNEFEVKSNGYVVAREILVDINEAIPDYVFEDDYDLMTLDQLREFLSENNHLPNIPSALEFEERGGIEVGELTRLLLEKQEELVLYVLQLENRIKSLEKN